MRVHWLTQTEENVPLKNDWLCASELVCLTSFPFVKRRTDWRLGRWTAKQAIAACLHWPTDPQALAQIEIRATPSGAPEALPPGLTTPLSFSISHRAERAMCAVSPVRMRLGCDLEIPEEHSHAFVTDYFTAEEQNLVARVGCEDRPSLLALLWSAKESALKALGQGLRLDTRSVVVTPIESQPDVSGWSPLQVRCVDNQVFHGWWRNTNGFLHTIVSNPDPECPIEIRVAESPLLGGDTVDPHTAPSLREEVAVRGAS
jgi:4'-phosphopantetheinyl transferase